MKLTRLYQKEALAGVMGPLRLIGSCYDPLSGGKAVEQ